MYLDTDGHDVRGNCFFLYPQAFGVEDILLSGTIDAAGAVSVSGYPDDDIGSETDKVAIAGQIVGEETSRCEFQGHWKITGRTNPFMLTRRAGISDGTLDMVHIVEANKPLNYTADIQYPQIDSRSDTGYLAFNAATLHIAQSQVDEFRHPEDLQSQLSVPTTFPSKGPIFEHPNDVLVECQAFQAGPKVISASFYIHEDSGGADNGGTDAASLNYDLKKQKFLSLSDIFRPRSAYPSLLSKLCGLALTKLNPSWFDRDEAKNLADGSTLSLDDFQYWCLTPYGLAFTFEPDPGGPNASTDTVMVPYALLRGVLRPEYMPPQP